jgi:peptidoglycan/LPS O-acetylase OafA/YrhL
MSTASVTEAGTSAKKPQIFFPNLDGLRFFSFFLVFLAHSFVSDYDYITQAPWYQAFKVQCFSDGDIGVSFFFVLSGFLISYLLMSEKNYTGRIDIPSFYIRRALRIWPLYYFCVFFGFVIFPMLKAKLGQTPNETANPILCSLFLNNVNTIINGPPDSSVLSVLWSVAIEEQFYLVWPVLFFFVPKKHYVFLFLGVMAASLTFRAFNVHGEIETHTLGVISDMAFGGLGAYLSMNSDRVKNYLQQSNPWINLIPYVAAVVFIFYREHIFVTPFLIVTKRIIIAFFFIWIILEQNFSPRSLFKISQLKIISTLGKYTYGLYCLHTIGILITLTVLRKLGLNKTSWEMILLQVPISMALSIVISYISYTYFESWFLKFKDRFAYITKG